MPAAPGVAVGFLPGNRAPAARAPARRHRVRPRHGLLRRARQHPGPVLNVRQPVRSRPGPQPEHRQRARPNHPPVCPSPRPVRTSPVPEPGRGQAGRAQRCPEQIDQPALVRRPALKGRAHPMRGLLLTARPERGRRGHVRRARETVRRIGVRQIHARPIIGRRTTHLRIIARRITAMDPITGAQGGDGSLLRQSLAQPSSMS